MNFSRKLKKTVAILLATLLFVTNFSTSSAAIIDIAVFDYNEEFTWRSIPEPVTLQLDCDAVSFCAVCEDNATDNLTCFIVDQTHGGVFSDTFSFDADGTTTTYGCSFPTGVYKIYFVGNDDIVKTSAAVVFTKYDL